MDEIHDDNIYTIGFLRWVMKGLNTSSQKNFFPQFITYTPVLKCHKTSFKK